MSTTTTDTRILTVTIPWRVDRALSPNARSHWSRKHSATQAARLATDLAMRQVVDLNDPAACFQTSRWPLTLHYLVGLGRRQRRHDDDNMISCMKPVRDQIAACLGMDDKHFVTGSMTQVRDDSGLGYVRVVIEEAPTP